MAGLFAHANTRRRSRSDMGKYMCLLAITASSRCFIIGSLPTVAPMGHSQGQTVGKWGESLRPDAQVIDSKDEGPAFWSFQVGASFLLSGLVGFGLVAATLTPPAMAEMTIEEKGMIDTKWRETVRDLRGARQEAEKQAVMEHKNAIKAFVEDKKKAEADMQAENQATAQELSNEKKAGLEKAKSLKGKDREEAAVAAARTYQEHVQDFIKDKTKKEAAMKATHEYKISQINEAKVKAFDAAAVAELEGLRKNEVDKQAALANM